MMIGSFTSPRAHWLVRGVFGIAVLGLLASACADEDPKKGVPPYEGGPGGSGSGGADQGGAGQVENCINGDVRECKIILGEFNGVVSCFVGVEECIDGAWGPCGDANDGGGNTT